MHWGWYKDLDQKKYNALFTPFFNNLDNNSKSVISKSAFDLEDNEVELFGRIDSEFKNVLIEYCREKGIKTQLKNVNKN
jgi:hypothetical protein